MSRFALSRRAGRLLSILTVLAIAACNKGTPAATTGTGSDAPVIAKRMSISWGMQPKGDATDVFLATTDERGQQVSHPIGTFPGTCSQITPAPEMNALMAVACSAGPTGTQLQAIVRQGREVLVMKLRTDEGVTPDPMAREEVTVIPAPSGAKIDVGP